MQRKIGKPIFFIGLMLLAFTSACQAIGPISPGQETATATLSPTAPPPTATLTYTPSLPPTRSPTASATFSPTATARPTPAAWQFSVFNELWSAVNENYLYQDFNGVDWEAVQEEIKAKIEAGVGEEAFYELMAEMIAGLGDEHSHYLSPEQATEDDAEFEGEYNYAGIGVLSMAVPERQRVTVLAVFPGSPAEQAGIDVHDSILEIDGQNILDENGVKRDLLRGPEDSQATLTVQTPGEQPRPVEITRKIINASQPVPYFAFTTPQGKRIGYIFLLSFNDQTIPRKFRNALEELQSGGQLDGLIIDNRHNEGGANTILEDILTYFEDGLVGRFINREGDQPFRIKGRNFNGSQKVPLVVLVGPGTVSFGEIFSGILKDSKRAYIIGQPSEGNVEILYYYGFSDDSRAWLAHDTFRPANHPDQNWEETGILPDLVVESNWDEVTFETDPVLKAALEYFDKQK